IYCSVDILSSCPSFIESMIPLHIASAVACWREFACNYSSILLKCEASIWFIKKLWGSVDKVVIVVITSGMAIIMAIVVLEALGRYTLHSTPGDIEDFALLTATYVYFLGAAHARRRKVHIFVDILQVLNLPKRFVKIVEVFALVIVILVSGTVAYYAIVNCCWATMNRITLQPSG
ncbi:TRAP transporter small permease, partial [Chloroflexota bacterium]